MGNNSFRFLFCFVFVFFVYFVEEVFSGGMWAEVRVEFCCDVVFARY